MLGQATNTYMYADDGRKLRTVQQWSGTNSKQTDYVGNVIYESVNGTAATLKRILVDGGYIEGGAYYFYQTDHLGNNRVVANASGGIVQTNHYYPFGMSFAEGATSSGQPYKYNGKELDTERGLNLYDYSARLMDPALGRFSTMDQRAEKYYGISPYAYCAGNPVNAIDPDGRLVIFINGMHFDNFKNREDKSAYWGGFDKKVMNHIKDWNADYIDGSHGGLKSLPSNLSMADRKSVGFNAGKEYASYFLFAYQNKNGSFKESIKIITHSMGAAYAKGFTEGLIEGGVPINIIEFEADFAPFQPTEQKAVTGIKTYQFSNDHDGVVDYWPLSQKGSIEGAEVTTDGNKSKGHAIIDFFDKIAKLPVGNYKVVDGEVVPQ